MARHALDRTPGTIGLWDKDFNLIASWSEDEQIFVTVDEEGVRRQLGPLVVGIEVN